MSGSFPAPSYQLRFEHRDQYLYARVEGSIVDYKIAKQYWSEIIDVLHQRKYKHLMVDRKFRQALSMPNALLLISDLAAAGCTKVKLAIVDHYYDPEKCGFEELAGSNRGLRILIFTDTDEAEKWLLKGLH